MVKQLNGVKQNVWWIKGSKIIQRPKSLKC